VEVIWATDVAVILREFNRETELFGELISIIFQD
jgi:hypothetical protein